MHKESLQIRSASAQDAAAIVRTHYDAVHVTAAADYDAATLEQWSSLSPERVARLTAQITQNPDSTVMLVAERNGLVVAFGEIVPSKSELRAVYVCPAAARKGVGRALLKALEAVARRHNVEELWLDSSLTAERFYSAHGYVSDGKAEHQLKSGKTMICVRMRKKLALK